MTAVTLRTRPNATWRLLPFAEFAQQISDRVDDPSAAGVDRYVGLEHLDPRSLRIRRWGSPSDVASTKLRFEAGDVIFGKRRAYQRKVAQASFDGICSAHAMVLRARPEVILPGFLPLLMTTDVFINRAVAISVGSLSPTINWRTLAGQRFAVPDVESQQRLVDVLGAAHQTAEAWQEASEKIRTAYRATLDDVIGHVRERAADVRPVRDVGEVQGGRQLSPKHRTGRSPIPYLRVANVFDGYFDLSEVKEMDFTTAERSVFGLRAGDILLNEGQSRELVGRSAICDGSVAGLGYQNTLIRFRAGRRILPEYAHACFRHAQYTGAFAAMASQTTSIAHLGVERFSRYRIPVPSLDEQRGAVDILNAIVDGGRATEERAASTREVLRGLTNTLLREEA